MESFRFGLQTVLSLRERQEMDSAAGLAQARRDAEAASRAREDLSAALEAGRSRLTEAHGAGGPAGHLRNLALVLGRVGERLRHADEECLAADRRVTESMKEYHAAFKHRRTLEQLRSHRLEEWNTEQARDEQKTMDELALTRHGRARDGEPEGS